MNEEEISAGYAMVPVEPTHEMLEALWGRSFDQFDEGGAKKIARIKYQGLLDALKSAPVVMPNRMTDGAADYAYARYSAGWNACLDELARLNRSKP